MCEQTEINYLDGDVVWVKLGSCWWPGEVTSFQNLPDDIQVEFKKKPLIAAVKFFQEDTYEFVKNLHQIYKYNCTQKDEFIKKGLDKYRTKKKDGSSYMDKFPGDVEMAEKLTGGDPDILTSTKFSPEEKPDISALFGEKKIPKRKRDRDETHRRSEGNVVVRKITHPRFLRESDHEIRIRQQPSSLPSTPKTPTTDSPQFSCHLCNFTSSRVNVIICHTKSHRSGSFESPIARPRISVHTPSKSVGRPTTGDNQKRKYVRKTKSETMKSKTPREVEPVKRKYTKQIDKTTPTMNKKKKSDPELREKLLADWDDETDEDMDLDVNKTIDDTMSSPSTKNFDTTMDESTNVDDRNVDDADDGNEIIKASEKLLRDTEKFATIIHDGSPSLSSSRNSNDKHPEDAIVSTPVVTTKDAKPSPAPKKFKKILSTDDAKSSAIVEKDDKQQSRFSCFDFDEDDMPEPTITPVRKIPRVFGEKNTSVKKEILKKFTMSQALKNEKAEEEAAAAAAAASAAIVTKVSNDLSRDKINDEKTKPKEKEPTPEPEKLDDHPKSSFTDDKQIPEQTKADLSINDDDRDRDDDNNTKINTTEEVEIVEIFEVEGEKDDAEMTDLSIRKIINEDLKPEIVDGIDKIDEIVNEPMNVEINVTENETIDKKDESPMEKSVEKPTEKSMEKPIEKPMEIQTDKDEIMSEIATTETEDETVSELADSLQGHSENSDTDGTLTTQGSWESASKPVEAKEIVEKVVVAPKRRGRPRKSLVVAPVASGNGDDSAKPETPTIKAKDSPANRGSCSERKTSESDSDRSYTGRRRKPNKRYLHSDIYTRSPDNRASKTDESQSETEEKLPRETKGKSRRGRKSTTIVETRSETVEQPKDHEFEFSSPKVEPAEIHDEPTASKVVDDEKKVVENKTRESDETIVETSASSVFDYGKKSDVIGSPINITKFLSGDGETSSKLNDETEETKETNEKSSIRSNDNIVNESPTTSEHIDLHQEIKITTKFDKLPPKKSQIKKFEMSQIDLLEACSVQVAAESEEAEKSMKFHDDTAMEVCTLSPAMEPRVEKDAIAEKDEKMLIQPVTVEEPENDGEKLIEKISDNAADELVKNSTIQTVEAELKRIENEEIIDNKEEKIDEEIPTMETKETIVTENIVKIVEPEPTPEPETPPTIEKPTTIEDKQPEKPSQEIKTYPVETVVKLPTKIVEDDDVPVNSYQEAFLKTLQIDKTEHKMNETEAVVEKPKESKLSTDNVPTETTASVAAVVINEESVSQQTQTVPLNAMTEFEGVEILVQENVDAEQKLDEANATQMDVASNVSETTANLDEANALSLDLQKIEDTLTDPIPVQLPPSEISMPVKKREKPRIIENVTLKEPMQILKSKLLEKLPTKSTKHKLDTDTPKKSETKGGPRAKIMKIDSSSSSSSSGKTKSSPKSHFVASKKLQTLKIEETTSVGTSDKDQASQSTQIPMAQAITHPADGEKFIQQSSQSLADMELDIDSMPFVLSEDVLTPESIEQMPVVISSIIPGVSSPTSIVASVASSSSSSSSSCITTSVVTTPLTLTSTAQLVASNQTQTITAESPTSSKKKSGTPAILKNKGKAKPTITSIKTLVPPLTGGVKGIKFQNPQTGKAMPMMSQKSTPGKYVIVQTGGQQMRYSVQGKPGMSQKIAIPAGKGSGNPQIVQQGGKVVILTSAQSGQTKMLPLNISKTLSGKVQKIVNNKGQVYTSISPQGIMSSKMIIAPKSETNSPTTSKLTSGQKIINTQGIITSKGVLTPISTSKTGLLSTLSQGIITKGGIYTPISSAQLTGKTLMTGKTMTNKTGTIISSLGSSSLTTGKTVLSPVSHQLAGKTIINAQGIVTPKGTVLTPITGQQVKALAAKSPGKGTKLHYQAVQQKLQLPMLQKCQKMPMTSSSSQTRASPTSKSPGSSGTIVFQNTIIPGQKVTTPSGKKIIRQVVGVRSPQTTITQQSALSPQQQQQQQQIVQQKGKSTTATSNVQRVTTPRSRQTKAQQKINVQKLQEATAGVSSPSLNIHGKPSTSVVCGNPTKKSPASNRGKNRNTQNQKHMLNVALSSISGPANESAISQLKHTQTPTPALVPMATAEVSSADHETIVKTDKSICDNIAKDNYKAETIARDPTLDGPKTEENKVATQPQIMALPTESSDGTQTYVLVTIDEQGQIQPLDNNTLMSLEGTTQNADGTRTLYIDPSSLGEAGALDNIVLQFDNGAMPNLQSTASVAETGQTAVTGENSSFTSSEIIQTSNQDILAAALANTDFQQEIGLPENTVSSVMPAGLTQTSLINQTILQSTIIPPTEPISSPSVLETSLTLNQPIMTPLEVPSSLPIQVEPTPASVISTIPTSLELPITITNPNISYIAASVGGETHIQIPGNSMPDIGDIMESPASAEMSQDVPASTQYLVIPSLDETMTIQARAIETGTDSVTGSVSYSVSIPETTVIETSKVQKTPSMPIIDDGYAESTDQQPEQQHYDVPTTNVEPEKSVDVAAATEITTETASTSVPTETPNESRENVEETIESKQELFSTQETTESSNVPKVEQTTIETPTVSKEITTDTIELKETLEKMEIDDEPSTEVVATSGTAADATPSSDMQVEAQSSDSFANDIPTKSDEIPATSETAEESEKSKIDNVVASTDHSSSKDEVVVRETTSVDGTKENSVVQNETPKTLMNVELSTSMEIYPPENSEVPEVGRSVEEASSQAEAIEPMVSDNSAEPMDEAPAASAPAASASASASTAETSQEESPSQSYEQFNSATVTSDSTDSPTQSANKSENSREPSQSIVYDPMEIDENTITGEPPTQSFEDSKQNEATQSYETTTSESNTNAPTQSFNEIMHGQEDVDASPTNAIDDQSFPTQSYEVGKMENLLENIENDGLVSQEINIPSQSNDIGNDGIGTSSVSTNNLGINEDETASSSYMPETPENQERDQDQESAISTSSYEIPPCEELNIASSSVIPDTSANSEHANIHNNGVPEIPTSSYSLNPDSSSTSHVDALPTSSYEDQVVVEQNVSTSYEVPISMPGLEETSSQNFVTESTDHRDEPTSYYARHTEVTASYYGNVHHQDDNSRLEADHTQEEVTPSYYDANNQDITSEASQSYFRPNPRYSNEQASPSYYETAPETEASQSYYSHEIEGGEQSSSRNVEASQSFYQETNDEMRLRQQGEATPTYTERYPVDYALANSPIERHDLVESSVPATRPTER